MTDHCKAIQTHRLWKSFRGQIVLREIDLEIASGECVALTGGNGAGKSTLLRCLAVLARPTAGNVFWFGQPAAAHPGQRSMVGMVAHESCLYAHLTVNENLLFAARMYAVTRPARRAGQLLEQTGLRSLADQPVRQISKGMQRRLALARAWIHEPPILLLDEPFSGLDAASCDWLAAWIMNARDGGRTVCFATHDHEQAARLADRTLTLSGGLLHGQHIAADSKAPGNVWRHAA